MKRILLILPLLLLLISCSKQNQKTAEEWCIYAVDLVHKDNHYDGEVIAHLSFVLKPSIEFAQSNKLTVYKNGYSAFKEDGKVYFYVMFKQTLIVETFTDHSLVEYVYFSAICWSGIRIYNIENYSKGVETTPFEQNKILDLDIEN